jgi:hypothetical protein
MAMAAKQCSVDSRDLPTRERPHFQEATNPSQGGRSQEILMTVDGGPSWPQFAYTAGMRPRPEATVNEF